MNNKDELTFLRRLANNLNDENLHLKSDIAYLKGEIAVYERFLKKVKVI